MWRYPYTYSRLIHLEITGSSAGDILGSNLSFITDPSQDPLQTVDEKQITISGEIFLRRLIDLLVDFMNSFDATPRVMTQLSYREKWEKIIQNRKPISVANQLV